MPPRTIRTICLYTCRNHESSLSLALWWLDEGVQLLRRCSRSLCRPASKVLGWDMPSMVLHKRCDTRVSKSVSMLGNQHSHALVLSFISSFLSPTLPPKSLVWRRQFKENGRSENRQPQSNIQTLRHQRRNASRSLKRRRRVSPLVDENHHELVVAVVVAATMVMTVVMTAKVVVVCLVRGHRDSVCGVLLFK
jgi:hypothetical protein